MPLPHSVLPGTRRSLRGLAHRALHHNPPAPAEGAQPSPSEAPRGIDASTRRYWLRGASAPAVLVEDSAHGEERRDRVAELVRAHERGAHAASGRPRGNPAFSEALFVELMRARQYRRAFEHLSEDCRRSWGSVDAFAAAQGGAMRRLLGVSVKDVRFLPEWTDARARRDYRDVAELDVEYALQSGDTTVPVPRVVHLVPDGGKWRSLCYPD